MCVFLVEVFPHSDTCTLFLSLHRGATICAEIPNGSIHRFNGFLQLGPSGGGVGGSSTSLSRPGSVGGGATPVVSPNSPHSSKSGVIAGELHFFVVFLAYYLCGWIVQRVFAV